MGARDEHGLFSMSGCIQITHYISIADQSIHVLFFFSLSLSLFARMITHVFHMISNRGLPQVKLFVSADPPDLMPVATVSLDGSRFPMPGQLGPGYCRGLEDYVPHINVANSQGRG